MHFTSFPVCVCGEGRGGRGSGRGEGGCLQTSRLTLTAWKYCGGREGVCSCLFFVFAVGGEVPTLPSQGVLLVGFLVAVMEGMGGEEHDRAMGTIEVMVSFNLANCFYLFA
jgi:hypothetical protein